MARGFKDKMTRKKAKAWPKPHRSGPIPTKTGIRNQLLCSLVETRARFIYLEWTSTVTRCEIGRVQCEHTIHHWFKVENSEVNSTSRHPKTKNRVYILWHLVICLSLKGIPLSLSIKTCARTRLVQRQKFVTWKYAGTPKWKPYWLHVKKNPENYS